ncbi:hypothetical protein INS49_007139 [Diaporthe citri]|uniref:uncharacterized protein n=1 Tax=Diaporthe citri TaxID=83186 RepID=UPI001C7FF283|nr:uncharacterized protein INS49_007139 [Diaporthe citri]KAG6365528.1 hypothetical protein INS49_007139 [Diaporthe citri]
MAEILGAVASGLGVAEVGLKVGGTVWKLKKLWHEVHEVPATIQDLMRQIEMMDPILSDHETNLGIQSTALPIPLPTHIGAPTPQTAAYCRDALNALRRLMEDLDGAVESEKRSRRTVARMKVVLKKDTIKGFQDRLEKAMRLLQWSQLNYLATNAAITGAMVTDMWTAVTGMQAQQQLMLQQLGSSNPSSSMGRPPFPVVTQNVETSRQQTLDKRRRAQRQGNSVSLPWSGPSKLGAIIFKKSGSDATGEASDALYLGFGYNEVCEVKAVHYGAEPRDWYFEVDCHYEEYAAAFWDLIDNPHLFEIPGAWVDEEWDSD